MSFITRSMRWVVLAAATVAGSSLMAQPYHPFAEPLAEFDPDWQWFAPIQLQDVEELSPMRRANHGFYATYDRMRVAFSRPDQADANELSDFTWGNRFDFGLTRNNDTGWSFSYSKITGPNIYNQIVQHRLWPFNAADDENFLQPVFPSFNRNDPEYNERVYEIRQSVNVGNYTSFEANQFWRKEPYRYGGIIEPLIGLRYTNFTDYAVNDSYFTDNTTTETFIRQLRATQNQMLLGQMGWHYLKYYKRFTFTNDTRVFFGQNFQSQSAETRQILTTGTTGAVTTEDVTTGTSFSGSNNQEFVVGMDLRAEVNYQATRYIDLRTGFMFNYFGRGIWRGANPGFGSNNLTDQDLIMAGWTFGVALNR